MIQIILNIHVKKTNISYIFSYFILILKTKKIVRPNKNNLNY
jgi:hypothetical protein